MCYYTFLIQRDNKQITANYSLHTQWIKKRRMWRMWRMWRSVSNRCSISSSCYYRSLSNTQHCTRSQENVSLHQKAISYRLKLCRIILRYFCYSFQIYGFPYSKKLQMNLLQAFRNNDNCEIGIINYSL